MSNQKALEAAWRIMDAIQNPASMMSGESVIFNITDVQECAEEVIRAALPKPEGEAVAVKQQHEVSDEQ